VLPEALWYDLVRDLEVLRLARDPDLFRREVEALARGWVVIDEVQRHPTLLNEVQALVARHGTRYRFALTGSSARKLRRGAPNLLPGRLVNRHFFPLVAAEMGAFELPEILRFGCLPSVRAERTVAGRVDLLDAYVENYIAQEIRAEAAVKTLEPFLRFLEVAALFNAQVVNVASAARDTGVARTTVQGYFETLVDTLIGTWLPAWRPRARVKETAHPKFYLFDPGVVRALAGRLREPVERAEQGPLLETYLLHELRAWMHQGRTGGELSYWRTPAGAEVDFVWTRAGGAVGIEAKATTRWRAQDGAALAELAEAGVVRRCFGVYLGDRALKDGPTHVLPVHEFLAALRAGKILR
jgi:predicted AAA+ superfamily ATPase